VRVGEIACGRAGDKGPIVDFTLVARDGEAYALLERRLDAQTVARALDVDEVTRYAVPPLLALKFVAPNALAGGAFASLRAGVHSQKSWIHALLDHELDP
jgi:hypothetical protein